MINGYFHSFIDQILQIILKEVMFIFQIQKNLGKVYFRYKQTVIHHKEKQ